MLQQAIVTYAATEIDAPFVGDVSTIDAQVGEQVAPGAVVLRLVNRATWPIEMEVPLLPLSRHR